MPLNAKLEPAKNPSQKGKFPALQANTGTPGWKRVFPRFGAACFWFGRAVPTQKARGFDCFLKKPLFEGGVGPGLGFFKVGFWMVQVGLRVGSVLVWGGGWLRNDVVRSMD